MHMTAIGDRDDAEGDVTFRTHQDNGVMYEYAHVNIKWKGGFFKSSITDDFIQKKEIKNGLVLYDIVEGDQKKGYSVFARHIEVKNYPVGFETKKIIKDEDRHPDFSDYDWIFKFKAENVENIEINGQISTSNLHKTYGALDPPAQQTVSHYLAGRTSQPQQEKFMLKLGLI